MKKIIRSILFAFTALLIISGVIYFLFPGVFLSAAVQAARFSAGVTMDKVAVDGHEWPFLEGGSGDTVILLHGFGMSKDFWGELLPALTKDYHVIVPDLPGFGENSPPKNCTRYIPTQVQGVRAFVEAKSVKNFFLIGFSLGGGIAAWYAGEYPTEVKGLVLIDPIGVDTGAVSELEKMMGEGEKPLLFRNVADYDRLMALAYHQPPQIPGHLKRYFAALGSESYGVHEKIFDDLDKGARDILRKRLGSIRASTLVVWGERDRIFDVSTAHVFNRGIAGSRVLIVRDAGHMVYLDKPAETVPGIVAFLQGL